MTHNPDLPPTAATDEPAVPATLPASRPACRVSDRLSEALIEPALDAGRDVRPGRALRHDGWTPGRIRTFIEALAECGVVEDAARAVGMSKRSAYKLRSRAQGRGFRIAWTAAEHLGRGRVSGEAMSRAIHGCVEVIMRDGQVWGERHRFDNRHTMAVLARLDRQAQADDEENRTARAVAERLDEYLDILCAGGEGAAAEFVARRVGTDDSPPSRDAVEAISDADVLEITSDDWAAYIEAQGTDDEEQRPRDIGEPTDVSAAATVRETEPAPPPDAEIAEPAPAAEDPLAGGPPYPGWVAPA